MTIMQTMSNSAQVNQTDIQKFRFGKLVQGNDSVEDYYSKLKRCNEVVQFSEDYLKGVFIKGLSSGNQFHVHNILEYNFSLDEFVEIIDQAGKERLTDYITGIKGNIDQTRISNKDVMLEH